MQNLFFISSYGIDTDVIHLLVMFEHRCLAHYLDTIVICLFKLFRHKCYLSIRIIYTWKLCTRLPCLNNAWHSCINDTNPWNNKFHTNLEWTHETYKFVMYRHPSLSNFTYFSLFVHFQWFKKLQMHYLKLHKKI
jgi:hypothetical protein